jgi:hypothetical protein
MVNFKTDFKLHLLKQTVNYIAPRILRLSSGVHDKEPQSKLLLRVWERLEATLRKEVATGCFNDKNFSKLLDSTKQGLTFLCDTDRYYRRWFGLLCVFIYEEMAREWQNFSYEKAKECNARPMMLTREEYEVHKASLFELYLTGYLYGLSLLPESETDKIRQARLNGSSVDYPSSDPKAVYRLHFPERDVQKSVNSS